MSDEPVELSPGDFAEPGQPQRDADFLRRVARQQKLVLGCVAAHLCAGFCMNILPQDLKLIAGLAMIGVLLAEAYFVFELGKVLFGPPLGVVCGLFALLPCLGLITMLVVNQKATALLQRYGVKVGFMGADPDSIR